MFIFVWFPLKEDSILSLASPSPSPTHLKAASPRGKHAGNTGLT